MKLDRPLAFLKIETTGLDVDRDRIVQIAVVKVSPDGSREERNRLLNPGGAIPPEATAIHGISDEDVAQQPTFCQVAKSLAAFLADSDLAGWNIARFDLPFLEAEFARAGIAFERPRVVDLLVLYQRMEPRTLAAAARFYLDRDHAGDAAADARLLPELLAAQLARYGETLPDDVEGLAAVCAPPDWIDSQGLLRWVNGRAVIQYGRKHRGEALEDVAERDPGYLDWSITESRLPHEVKAILRAARAGRFPTPPPLPEIPPSDEPPWEWPP